MLVADVWPFSLLSDLLSALAIEKVPDVCRLILGDGLLASLKNACALALKIREKMLSS